VEKLSERRPEQMAEMPKEVMDLFNDPAASKVLATCDKGGNLNIAPKGSLAAINAETLVYADIFGGKTRENLEATQKVAAVAFKPAPPFPGFQVKGTFQGFQSSGPLYDNFAAEVKKALKMDTKAVGVIKVDEVYSVGPPRTGEKLA